MDCDVLVIGGGIAGTSAGAALSGSGRVIVWEAEDHLAHHASGRSAALFEEAYGNAATVALNRASRAAHAAAGHMTPRGLVVIGLRGEEAQFARDRAAMGLEAITPDEARAVVPILSDAVTDAGWHADAWDLDTGAMVEAGARAVRAAGGAVETRRRVRALRRDGDGWTAAAGGETVRARMVVNAAGPWADAVAAMAGVRPLGLTPLRRSIARIRAPGGRDVTRWPMLLGAGETWYAKPDAGALIVSPAEEDPVEAPHDAWADDLVLAEGMARYEAAVTEPVTRPIATWAGLRTFAPDRALVLGRAPDAPTFLWCAGQGGYGFQTAPAAARLLADIAEGRTPDLDASTVAALDPRRLH